MKSKLLSFATLLTGLLILCSCSKAEAGPPDEGYDIFLLIGQSNMAGRGTMLPADYASDIAGVWLLGDGEVPVPARNPLNKYSSVRKKLADQQINPGYSFSQKIATVTGRKVLLVVNARGGTLMSEWSPGALSTTIPDSEKNARKTIPNNFYYKANTDPDGNIYLYDEAVRRCKEAMKYGTLKAILWHQGESDSGRSAAYQTEVATLAANLRRDLGVTAANVPFVAGQICQWRSGHSTFNNMIIGISGFVTNSDCISSTIPVGMTNGGMQIDATDPHFNRDAQLLLGKRYANKVLKMVYGITDNNE